MANFKNNQSKPSVKPSVAAAAHGAEGARGPGHEVLVSRRRFLYGAVGIGAAAAVGAGAIAVNASHVGQSADIDYLKAPADALSTLNDFETLDSAEAALSQVAEFDLPYGTLIWASDDSIAACLLPTETGSPLAQVGILFLGSGQVDTVLEKATSADAGFEIYDVRANADGIVWTEANILQGTWRVFTAPLADGSIGTPQLAREGDDSFDMPTLAVVGKRAFWLENAKPVEEGDVPASRLMAATFGSANAESIYESRRRMAAAPYASADSVTIAPRLDAPGTYYQLTNVDASSGAVRDTLTLPRAIAPMECGYGPTGFMFSFSDIYNYEGAISNLGTYTPFDRPEDGNYSTAKWFGFARTPTAAPAWCGDLLIVKSTYAVCGVDLKTRTYFAIDVDNGAEAHGEYLASSGEHDTVVTYTNIDHQPIGEEKAHVCRVKVWTPLTAAERKAYLDAQENGETALA